MNGPDGRRGVPTAYDQTFEPTLDPGTCRPLHRALADRDLHLRAVLRTRISLSAWFIRFSVASSDVRMVRGQVTFRRLA